MKGNRNRYKSLGGLDGLVFAYADRLSRPQGISQKENTNKYVIKMQDLFTEYEELHCLYKRRNLKTDDKFRVIEVKYYNALDKCA